MKTNLNFIELINRYINHKLLYYIYLVFLLLTFEILYPLYLDLILYSYLVNIR